MRQNPKLVETFTCLRSIRGLKCQNSVETWSCGPFSLGVSMSLSFSLGILMSWLFAPWKNVLESRCCGLIASVSRCCGFLASESQCRSLLVLESQCFGIWASMASFSFSLNLLCHKLTSTCELLIDPNYFVSH